MGGTSLEPCLVSAFWPVMPDWSSSGGAVVRFQRMTCRGEFIVGNDPGPALGSKAVKRSFRFPFADFAAVVFGGLPFRVHG